LELSQIALETISLGLLGETARRSIQSSARVRSQLRRRRSTPLESARLAPNRPAPQLVSLRNKR
jgi:hypothetical protein